ncbi:hypothetical protein [Actinomyces sp.]|uniref:hypothetical protein n=1 Tax=Actinomyces sp. TaxID=29317 RepID=UPI0026DCEE01|nr:hypothetical protein [Actinomyces sp.]MDO4901655.1 hypothetical protein [Actinomyces sp.]
MESWADGQDTVLKATTQLYPEWPEFLPQRLVVEAEIRPETTAAEVCDLADQLNGLFDPEAGDDIRRDLSLRLTRNGTGIVYEDQLFWPRSSAGRDWEAPHCAPLEYAYELAGPVMEALPANDDGLVWLDSQGDSASVRPADSVVSLTARWLEDQPGGPTVEEQAAVPAVVEGTPRLADPDALYEAAQELRG